jgi:hypothetical protein
VWKRIPPNILHDIHVLNDYTSSTDRESTLTVCKKKDDNSLFTAAATGGENESVQSLGCDKRFGDVQRVSDLHTHPSGEMYSGLTPSHADLAVNLAESNENKKKQISCISNRESELIVCNESKSVPKRSKVTQYINKERSGGDFYNSKFHRRNVPRDFTTAYFDPATGNKVKPTDEQVTRTMFGASLNAIKQENWSKKDRVNICGYMADITAHPQRKTYTNKCSNMLSQDNQE